MTVIVQELTDESKFEEIGRIKDGEITAGKDALTAIDTASVWEGLSPGELTARFDGPRIMASVVIDEGDGDSVTAEATVEQKTDARRRARRLRLPAAGPRAAGRP